MDTTQTLDANTALAALAAAPIGIFVSAGDGIIVWANEALGELLNVSADGLVGLSAECLPLSIERRLSPEVLEMRAASPDGEGEQRFQCTVRSLRLADGSAVECGYLTPLPGTAHGANSLTVLGALELDPVTGLPGRLSIARVLDAELSRSRRYENPLSALLIKATPADGDPTGAHGQALIRRTAQLVREQIRWVDKVGLWGPEELLLILPETPRESAEQLASKIETTLCSEMLAPEDGAAEVEFSVVLTEAQRADDADRLVGRLGASGATAVDVPISA